MQNREKKVLKSSDLSNFENSILTRNSKRQKDLRKKKKKKYKTSLVGKVISHWDMINNYETIHV